MSRYRPPTRPGSKFITPEGHERLRSELDQLWRVERPQVTQAVSAAAAQGDRSENAEYIYGKKRLREIDRRVRFLRKRLEIAEVVDPAAQPNREQVFFGAAVTYVDSRDRERTVTIVGVDEARIDLGEVSFTAPIARALMKARVGDTVELRTPSGPEEIEVLAIAYPAAASEPA